MQDNDVIEQLSNPWASPMVLVRKKYDPTRFCVDYRRLTCWQYLDLKSRYWQVETYLEDKEKTAFTTGQKLWQFQDMPFILCNVPSTLKFLMETVLGELSYKACQVYLDGIILVGHSYKENLNSNRHVLQKLKEANLKLNPSKCNLFW
ncbi:retrovirus-related Pol polyprotein from transposon 297 [Trichonephila clavipes]|nr:retrovirus-related Pol polyprotein from transposon 297 [Trichonephila clavipes]